ncbi:hypothetical protein SBOR_7652 [Sclerotinia borealis F-4128]|uniref:Uncharacterized protein n=1 Tax=Sclerotinia borealis (strain F-4128) TaxID=1432307 RepID=W9C5D3_SCLBF|nr:hypothetical protein SBOR_7652 [Sclerotinia borealis F-4128]
MADVRSLLRNERAARRIQHKHAGYSTAGILMCHVCHLQLKSESLWEGHLRSPGHIIRLSKQQEAERERNAAADTDGGEGNNKKRKADDEEEDIGYGTGTSKKRSKASPISLEESFVPATEISKERSESPSKSGIPPDMQIPSRPATPAKITKSPPPINQTTVDEDEWAAFEADVAAADVPAEVESEAVISAPAMTTAEVAARSTEEEKTRKKQILEAELEGDKEDADKKLQDEFETMESLELKVKRLREKREALREKQNKASAPTETPIAVDTLEDDDDDDDEDEDEDEDNWDGFRLR